MNKSFKFAKIACIACFAAVLAFALAGCGGGSGDSAKGSSAASSETAQGKQVSFPDDYLVAPNSNWEKVAHVENSALIEGMNWHDGELWFIDVRTGKIQKVTSDGQVVDVFVGEPMKEMPNGAKFINDTTMLITDRNLGLCTYDTQTGEYTVHVSDFNGQKFLGLNDLVLDGKGGAYFTDPGQSDYLNKDGKVYYVNYEQGWDVQLFHEGFAYPNGITISPDGDFIYVAEFNTNSFIAMPSLTSSNPFDTPYVQARLAGGHGPDGVITDADGNIYAAHLGAGEVTIVTSDGFPVKSVRLPEGSDPRVSNLLINDGFLYVTDFGDGDIWRIATTAQPNPLA